MDQMTKAIGRLCWELSTEMAINEIEAIEEKIQKVEKAIDIKVAHNIDAALDIELHSALQLVRAEYVNAEKVNAG
jgi:molybdopterin synthase catalytic subunit